MRRFRRIFLRKQNQPKTAGLIPISFIEITLDKTE